MENIEKIKCLIIGSGPAGYTAAIYAARADLKPVLYQGMEPGGQLMLTTDVDNFPGYPQGVHGQQMMLDLENQAKRFETDIRYGWVTKVDFTAPPHKVTIEDGKKEILAETVIIATGASAKWLGIPSELRLRDAGGGVSACAVCDGFFYRNQTVAIVGGGDTACEEASYLAKLCTKVYMIVRKDLRASKAMQHRVKSLPNIEILYNYETQEVLGKDKVEGVILKNNITQETKTIDVTGFFVAIGHKPNTDVFKDWLEMDEVGYIKIAKPGSTYTNREGVFVAGDAADKIYRQAITAAGTGCMAALDAERYLAAKGLH